MQKYKQYLEEDFIIFNSDLGVRDFVTIGEINFETNTAYLDEPYEMVGPFCLDELCTNGEISFAACIVMSEQIWEEKQALLLRNSFEKQRKSQKQFYEDIHNHNKRKRENQIDLNEQSQREYRKLLSLPIEGTLNVSQIKAAFRKVVKTTHPDVGGSHEMFIKITEARDILLKK